MLKYRFVRSPVAPEDEGRRDAISLDAAHRRAPEKVFDTLADVEHRPEWANENAKLTMSPVSGGPPALGATYRSQQVFAGKPQTADIEIVQFDRPSRFAFAISQRKEGGGKEVHYTHTFILWPEGRGTRLERTTDGGGNPVVGFLAKPAIMKDGRTSLGNLKSRVEASA